MDITTVLLLILTALVILLFVIIFMRTKPVKNDNSEIMTELERMRQENSRMSRELSELHEKELALINNKFLEQQKSVTDTLIKMNENQTSQLTSITSSNTNAISSLSTTVETRMNSIRDIVDTKMDSIRKSNDEKLEEMRKTVDEKLHKTLETRLSESFKTVSDQLESVYKSLGEMNTLATDVGDLKKVLTNVKTRGITGEIQLESILEQILTPQQYESNVKTHPEKNNRVEFAIKLPNRDQSEENSLYLPIDAKFPLESYNRLISAYESVDNALISSCKKELENAVKKSAKDIYEKYIEPPYTTDFAILFLPTEGLYAEIIRSTELYELLQREYHVTIAGPTTLSAILNALQMGFKTLAIEKRSSEVWTVLGKVKGEFSKFETQLTKTQTSLNTASKNLDDLVGVRTRSIIRSLKSVEMLPSGDDEGFITDDLLI